MEFQTVFDAAQSGYRAWPFVASGFMFAIPFYILAFRPELVLKIFPEAVGQLKGKSEKKFARFAFYCSVFWICGAFFVTFGNHLIIQYSIKYKDYKTIEGKVYDFKVGPRWGRGSDNESFKVNGVTFKYSTLGWSNGFSDNGPDGPIKDGVYVRIHYLAHIILKLEVAKNKAVTSSF